MPTRVRFCNVLLSCFLLVLTAFTSFANDDDAPGGSIRGKVITVDGQPAAYVNVILKNTNRGTVTAEDGSYLLKGLKEGQYTVVVSFVGMQDSEVSVAVGAGQTVEANISLQENARQLTEVMIRGRRNINEEPVTIGKIAIKPMDLPQSITIVGKEILEQQQVLRLSDALLNINGVYQMGNTGGTQEELAGRGFAFNSNNTFKNGSRFNNGIFPEMSGIERVEVMKGSNAILYGNVGPGGVINLVTKKPQFANGGQISLRTGSFGFYKPSLDIYGAFNNSDKIAYRINTSYERGNSFRDVVNSERFYINPSFLIKAGEKTDILVEGDYLKDTRTLDYGIGAINYTIPNVPRGRFIGAEWSYNKTEQKGVTTTITHRFSRAWNIRAVGSYQTYSNDLFGTTRPNASGQMIQASGKWIRGLQRSQVEEDYYLGQIDLNGQFATGPIKHTFLFGADADRYFTATTAYSPIARYDSINIYNPNEYKQRADIPSLNRNTLTKSPINRVGVYVQDLIALSEKLKVLAGVRYSYQQRVSEVYTYSTQKAVETDYFDGAFTPRFGLVYQPLKTMSIFASYANSFVQNAGIDVTGNALPVSFINQYEVGAKNELFDGLLSANVTLYRIVNSNLAQTVVPANATYPNAQELAGEVTSKGIEVDLMSKPYRGFSFVGGYSYNDTRYTRSNIYIVGSRLRYNPQHTANASLFYTVSDNFLKGLNVGFTTFYFGDRVAGRSTRLTVKNDAFKLMALPNYFQFDASAGYTLNRLSVRVKVSNLLNKLTYNVHDDNSVNPIAPRQYSATIAYKL
ncbi:TonB-dependent siderophore receptor [Tellurirhabdus rosea]|uniref:TonB-dependent siderophore receptor n=1 Tax=Tellurirhabdus rosea TaxID=2674997 RepID=UPI002258E73B|nr:TonB-dependent receptor [Tellurirhabdus rosea]